MPHFITFDLLFVPQFRCHEYEGGLKLYTESVICAPEFGPELSLAYGNRSACLYHLGHYKDCLQDIELAFRFRYFTKKHSPSFAKVEHSFLKSPKC